MTFSSVQNTNYVHYLIIFFLLTEGKVMKKEPDVTVRFMIRVKENDRRNTSIGGCG